MKHRLLITLAVSLMTPMLFAQTRTDAEERYKMKTGRLHPSVERRLEEQRKAAERSRAVEFRSLDKNQDGAISDQEWRSTSARDAACCACACQQAGQ